MSNTDPASTPCAGVGCAPSCGVGTLRRAQRSSRWLGRGGVALLFAHASFGRLVLDAPATASRRVPAALDRRLARSAFRARAPLIRSSGTAGVGPSAPSRLEEP